MSEKQWFYITNASNKNEQERDVSGNREVDLVFSDDDRFTLHDVVPIVSENHEEGDFDDENDVGV